MPKFPYKLWDNARLDRHFKNFLNVFIKDVETDFKEQKSRVDELISSTPQPDEIVDLRIDEEGVTYPVARDRFHSDHEKFRTRFERNEQNTGVLSMLGNRIRSLVQTVLERGINVMDYNVHGDGVTDDTAEFRRIFSNLKDGDKVIIPYGYKFLLSGDAIDILANDILITGGGTILSERGFRIRGNRIHVSGLKHLCSTYRINTAMYFTDATPDESIEDIKISYCYFNGFFYATNFRSISQEISVFNTSIDHCDSIAPNGRNAGHFQHVRVKNSTVSFCTTIGGQNATSYNFFESVGFIRNVSNYEEGNSYGALEIENGSGRATVIGCTFESRIWLDDSFDCVVTGCITNDGVRISVGSDKGDSENIVIANTVCKSISAIPFGDYKGGEITNIQIVDTRIRGGGNNGILINGNVVNNILIDNVSIGAGYAISKIGIIRAPGLHATVRDSQINGVITISGGGGTVYAFKNHGANYNGMRDQMSRSYLESAFNGITLVAANGKKFRFYTNNSGQIQSEEY